MVVVGGGEGRGREGLGGHELQGEKNACPRLAGYDTMIQHDIPDFQAKKEPIL